MRARRAVARLLLLLLVLYEGFDYATPTLPGAFSLDGSSHVAGVSTTAPRGGVLSAPPADTRAATVRAPTAPAACPPVRLPTLHASREGRLSRGRDRLPDPPPTDDH